MTGQRLFSGEHEAAVIRRVIEGRVEQPSKFAPEIPAALDALIMRGLSLRPEDRFATAGEMATAIEDAMPPVPASRIGAWVDSVAKEALAGRRRRIEAIELDSSTGTPQVPMPANRPNVR